MKKNFKFYALIWVIMLAAFNAIVFLVRPIIPGYVINYDARFWVVWSFIMVAFIGNLACAYIAFKAENLKKTFYNLPLITISCTGLIIMAVFGALLMVIPDCPVWIASIVSIVVFVFNVIAVIKATAAAGVVNSIDEKTKSQMFFIKNLTADAEGLWASARSEGLKGEARKVYDAIRYSDPMSNASLSELELEIKKQFAEFSNAVDAEDAELAKSSAQGLMTMLEKRNQKCKLLK